MVYDVSSAVSKEPGEEIGGSNPSLGTIFFLCLGVSMVFVRVVGRQGKCEG